MAEPSKARTAQVYTSDGWKSVGLSQIEPGNRFRVLRPDGSTVAGRCGSQEFVAAPQLNRRTPEALQKRVQERFSSLFATRPVARV